MVSPALLLQVKAQLTDYGTLKAFNLVMDKSTGNSKVSLLRFGVADAAAAAVDTTAVLAAAAVSVMIQQGSLQQAECSIHVAS